MLRPIVQLSQHYADQIRSLCAAVYYVRDPLEKIDSVVAMALADVDQYRAALDEALASNAPLANLGPEYHPEPIVRRFLAEVRRRIEVLN